MRKIEQQMNDAIQNEKNWKNGNTEVVNIGNESFVYLYSNLIAIVGDTFIELFDGGHQTATTKSRLNAILAVHGVPGEYVFQKNFKWFVNYDKQGAIPFFSGMRLA